MLDVHTLTYAGYIALPVAMAILIAWAARSKPVTFCMLAWMLITAALARSGILGHFNSRPPPIALLFVSGFVATIAMGMSRWVRRLIELPLTLLVVVQSFRVLVEILMHEAHTIGLAPIQMTWNGYNFDIFTGITALALAPFANRTSARLVFIWNCLGLTLLIWVVGIAIVSLPTPFQLLRPANTWVASFPYVWLPTVLVTVALLGHIIIFRKLALNEASGKTTAN
jgi:hypothetical protein